MSAALQELINFHLTGKRDNAQTESMAGADTVPALLAPYRDLLSLRYDYPLILVEGAETQAFVCKFAMSSGVDRYCVSACATT